MSLYPWLIIQSVNFLSQVTSPYGNNLHQKENQTTGQFAFTTAEAGNHLACFWVDGHHQGGGEVSLNLDWRTGISAKDWDSVAKKEKIEVCFLLKLTVSRYVCH